jgi:signal transduction histidine kinase
MIGFSWIFPKSIAGRLIAFSVTFALAMIALASLVVWLILIGVVREQIDQRLDVQISGLREAIHVSPDGQLGISRGFDNPPFDKAGSGWYWEVDGKDARFTSKSLQDVRLERPPRPTDWRSLLMGAPRTADGSQTVGRTLHFRFVQTLVKGVPIEITATAPASALRSPAFAALFWLVPLMMALAILLIAGVLLQVRYGLAPLTRLRIEIAEVSSGRISAVSDQAADELRPVATEINRLVAQSRKRLADTRLHFANLAHGLKTPVASLAVALDNRNDADGELRSLTKRIENRIRHHLGRTRASLSDAGLFSSTPVGQCVNDILHMMKRIYPDKKVDVRYEAATQDCVCCSSDDLGEILGAVIDNAFKWAAHRVAVDVRGAGETLNITIMDDGPGINDNNLLLATLPGVRLDESVMGDGFGLSIAREIIELHGGGLNLQNGPMGGLIVTVALPRSP